jgi:protein phosphatase 4 regulatory subunit 3
LIHITDDALSDDALDSITTSFALSAPTLGNLDEIEQTIRAASISQAGREALSKFVVREDYISKLIPLLSDAEDLESLPELHRLCNIMKAFILMNDNSVIEHMVDDDLILGVVGALEYDPDFPTHKANHRQYLGDQSRYKQVVEIKDQKIKKKIRQTWRLQYLKDVVLARILDDPTFGVLNSMIYFNQVDIVQHLQSNATFLKELFAIFNDDAQEPGKREEAVHFLQQCAAITKTLQVQARQDLLNNFVSHGLFAVITFAIRHTQPSMRTTGIDILVALLDHNPNMMRNYMLKAVHENKKPLTDVLIEILHAETDLGVKNQLADALKILLDPQPPTNEPVNNRNTSEFVAKISRPPQLTPTQAANEQFAQDHFDRSCRKLFKPLKDLEHRRTTNLGHQEVSLFSYLVEILTFFLRQHMMRSRHFVGTENLTPRVAQLLKVPQKPLKLNALKFFRTGIALNDQFYAQQTLKSYSLEPILDIVIETMPRDNLLNSACLEMFEHICRETVKPIILHLGEHYRQKLEQIQYVDTFNRILIRYEQLTVDRSEMEHTLFSNGDESPSTNTQNVNGRWAHGLVDMDAQEEDYFNTSDDDEDGHVDEDISDRMHYKLKSPAELVNGDTSPSNRPLVDYPDDDDDDDTDDLLVDNKPVITPQTPLTPESESEDSPDSKSAASEKQSTQRQLQPSPEIRSTPEASTDLQHPPERLAEKRRRQEDDEEDELGKLSTGVKRRNSSSGGNSSSLLSQGSSVRRKKGFLRSKQSITPTSEGPPLAVKALEGSADVEAEPVADENTPRSKSQKIKVSLTGLASKAAQRNAGGEKGKPAEEETAK